MGKWRWVAAIAGSFAVLILFTVASRKRLAADPPGASKTVQVVSSPDTDSTVSRLPGTAVEASAPRPARPERKGNAAGREGSNQVPRDSEPTEQSVPAVSEPSALELLDAKSAVGRPFPLSASVMNTCVSMVREKSDCPLMIDFLQEFAREPRDIAWARDSEERLERAITQYDHRQFSVRTIECRTTRCMVEVVADEACLCHFWESKEIGGRLWGPVPGDLGFEKGPDGERIIVTALGYERR